MAAVILPNIKPIINSAMVSFTLEATTMTANNTKKLPILEAIASETSFTIPKARTPEKTAEPMMRIAAPKLAPELTPKTNGPAKGFLKRVCINSPLKANPLPTSTAVKALGIL